MSIAVDSPSTLTLEQHPSSGSPAATACAVSALVMAEQYSGGSLKAPPADRFDTAYQGDLSELLIDSLCWLSKQQNSDGGFGTQAGQPSDLLSSVLVQSAFRLTCLPAKQSELEPKLDAYLRAANGVPALRKQSLPRARLQGVLTNAALAGLITWRQTPIVRFETVCSPRWLRLLLARPQFDRQDPVLLACGLARHQRVKSPNPFLRWARTVSADRCVAEISSCQSDDGSFGSLTETCFVTLALAAAGQASCRVTRRAVEFVLSSVDQQASWHEPLPGPIPPS